jgi:hypothetical protein
VIEARPGEIAVIKAPIVFAALVLANSAASAEEIAKKAPIVIGDARMLGDGTVILNFRRTADGIHVSGSKKYPVGHPEDQEILDHLGGMSPGETKLLPAWDDPVAEKK